MNPFSMKFNAQVFVIEFGVCLFNAIRKLKKEAIIFSIIKVEYA